MVTAQAKFDRIAQRRTADDFDVHPIAKTHFEQTSPQWLIAVDSDDRAMATNAEIMQRAGVGGTAVVTFGKIAGFLHQTAPIQMRPLVLT